MANDFFNGFTHGFLSLLGAGQAYDQLGDLQSSLGEAASRMRSTIDIGSYSSMKQQEGLNKDFWNYIQTNNDTIQESIDLYNKLATNGIQKQNLFTTLLLMIVLIIIFFMLIK